MWRGVSLGGAPGGPGMAGVFSRAIRARGSTRILVRPRPGVYRPPSDPTGPVAGHQGQVRDQEHRQADGQVMDLDQHESDEPNGPGRQEQGRSGRWSVRHGSRGSRATSAFWLMHPGRGHPTSPTDQIIGIGQIQGAGARIPLGWRDVTGVADAIWRGEILRRQATT
jgi:hypothetical protein